MTLGKLRNWVPSLILKSPIHVLMSRRYMLLTFQGRSSGGSYTTPVAYLQKGPCLLLTTDSRWWKNLVPEAPVTVQLHGRALPGIARPVVDARAAEEGLRALVEAIPSYGAFARVGRDRAGRAEKADLETQ